MSYVLQEKVEVSGSKLHVLIKGWLTDGISGFEPHQGWFMGLFTTKDDQRIGSWPVDDWRSDNNVHIGPIEEGIDWTIDLWLRRHGAEELLPEVKAKIKEIKKKLVGHQQYLSALKSGPPKGWSGFWPDIDEDGNAIDF